MAINLKFDLLTQIHLAGIAFKFICIDQMETIIDLFAMSLNSWRFR